MKKWVPWLITIGVLGLMAVVMLAANRKLPKRMDERITLRAKDKIPYGFAAAKQLSTSLFPTASVYSEDRGPGYWNVLSNSSSGQAVVLVADYFNADDYEIDQLMKFAENGNYVFIIAKSFSTEAQTAFGFSYGQDDLGPLFGASEDSLKVRLTTPSFTSDSFYVYPGKKYESWFENLDRAHATVLGRNEREPNFIRMDKGDGSIFIHSAPLAFSNYFILHKNNIHYFEQAMSVIPAGVRKIVWDEYYLSKRSSSRNNNRSKKPDFLGVLFRYEAFKWGLLTILGTLILLILLNSRRKQRMIPGHPTPRNESLDFVKTMGRLYYDRKDHKNLAKKMAAYFLEHVRSTYKLSTHTLDDAFIESLQYKSGYERGHLNEIISFIDYLQNDHSVNETQLINFHNQLEAFYQNT